jgi:hypothetical protein
MNEEELKIVEKENEEIFISEDDDKEILLLKENLNAGTDNYNYLVNKPKINDVELKDNKTSKELKLQDEMDSLTNIEIENILNNFIGGI